MIWFTGYLWAFALKKEWTMPIIGVDNIKQYIYI